MLLKGKVALVTGASRGIGRGIAIELGKAHATVYITGRKSKSEADTVDFPTLEDTGKEIAKHGGEPVVVYCDHSNPDEVKRLFERIEKEQHGRLDILVNNAFSAASAMVYAASGKKFWELDPLIWDDVNNVGLRNHYICSVYAARLMVPRKQGLIVNITSPGAIGYFFNVAYGVGKAAMDRMTADCAIELRKENVAVISLWPGLVRTELVKKWNDEDLGPKIAKMFENMREHSESPEYDGKCVVHLAADLNLMQKTGQVWTSRDVGDHYGFTDVDGKKPGNFRTVKMLLQISGWTGTANWVPEFVKVPLWLLQATGKLA